MRAYRKRRRPELLGHEIATMSYGLYAGNVTLATKRAAIEKLDYGQEAKT